MAVAPTPVAAAPDAPDRAQRATFSARATAFFDWIKNTFVAGVNALASNVYANAQDAASSAANAVAQSASATAQAGIATAQAAAATSAAATATTQAGVATTQAASIITAAATSTAKADVATAKAAEATAAAATATAVTLGVATGYPIIRPSLTLDFANSQIFDPRITFTRASAATRVNSMGLIETVASGVSRLTFAALTGACEGYLVEEQRTNMCTWSDSPLTAMSPWKCALIGTAVLAPDGVCVANKLVEDTASNTHNASVSLSVTAGTTYTFSAFVKAGERTSASVALNANNGAFAPTEISVNLATGECAVLAGSPVSYGAVPFKNGWWRVHITGTAIATAVGVPSVGARSTSSSYTGDGTSGIYLWGVQLEAGSFPTSYIPSSVTHTGRASTATFIGSNGLIQTAASGVARYSYNPLNLTAAPALLLEAAATNLLLRSEEFDNASWTKTRATITANATTAPDGTLTGDKIVSDATAADTHDIRQLVTVSDTTFALSIYFKAAECTWALIEVQNTAATGNRARAWFNLATGVVGAGNTAGAGVTYVSHSITNAGGGWYRCSLTCTTALTGLQIFIEPTTGDNITNWSGNSTDGAFVWGAQLEAGAFPTSYIPTTTATVTRAADTSTSAATTRAADVAVMTGANFSSWYRQDEGTFVVNGKRSQPVPAAQYPRLLQVGTSAANTMAVLFGGGSWLYAFSVFGGAEVFNAGATRTATVDNRVSMAYKRDDYALSINGGVAAADTTGDVPTVTRLAVGLDYGAWEFFNGTISDLTYYPLRLTNAELQALSAQ